LTNGDFSVPFSLTEEIANTVRDRILKGEYGIGERIKESLIAEELRVSRTPVREAIKQLEKEGLIKSIPNRGSYAIGFTKQDIEDIYAVRTVVEVLAMRWAVNKITEEEISKLQDEYDVMEFYAKKKDGKKVAEVNKRFHEIVYNASRSRFLVQILKSYQEYVEQTRKVTVYCENNLKAILSEHKGILEAIIEKDEDKAVKKILTHLANSHERAEVGMKINKKDFL
jgi:GntR family transcriptional regulator, rspAB operon transcriptional repressor